jgi:hypothetical protein
MATTYQLPSYLSSLNTTAPDEFELPSAATLGTEQGQYIHNALSGYAGMPIIQSQLAGEVSPDVMSNIYQTAAERGVSGSGVGSPNSNAAMLRALGLTSMGQQEKGLSSLNSAIGTVPALNPLGLSGQALSAYQTQLSQAEENARAQLSAQNQAAIAAANRDTELEKARMEAQNAALNRSAQQQAQSAALAAQQQAAQQAQQRIDSQNAAQAKMLEQMIRNYEQGRTGGGGGGGGGTGSGGGNGIPLYQDQGTGTRGTGSGVMMNLPISDWEYQSLLNAGYTPQEVRYLFGQEPSSMEDEFLDEQDAFDAANQEFYGPYEYPDQEYDPYYGI